MKNIFCPISDERVNEQVTRITALQVMLVVIAAFAFDSAIIMGLLTADFYIRAFTQMKISPLSFVASKVVKSLKLTGKKIDKAPKIFAARMGFTMALVVALLFVLHLHTAAAVVAGVLVFFAGLEFAFAFCAGCTIYTYFVLPFYTD